MISGNSFKFHTLYPPCFCVNLFLDNFYSYDKALACISSVPFSPSVRDDTITTVNKTYTMYVFRDIVKNSPAPMSIKINMEEQLTALRNKAFSNDLAFHQTLTDTFKQLNDGHTMYYGPVCYGNVQFMQPFVLVSILDATDGKQKISIAATSNSTLDAYYAATFGINTAELVGSTIVSIDGVDALQALIQFSNTKVGAYKDLGTRFNAAIQSLFVTRAQNRIEAPSQANMTYVVQKSDGSQVTMSIPWVSMSIASYNTYADFYASCFKPKQSKRSSVAVNSKKIVLEEAEATTQSFSNPLTASTASQIVLKLNGDSIKYYEIDGKIGVIKIPTFGPASNSQFAKDFQVALFMAKLNNIKQLIIDLIGNGGGEECFAYSMSKYLYPMEYQVDYQELYGKTDMIQSELGAALAGAAAATAATGDANNLWHPNHWRNVNGTVFNSADWFTQPITHERGGISDKYSQIIKENYCQSFFDYFDYKSAPVAVNYYAPDDIILISNGRCASTCALFSRRLQESKRVKTVVVGGVLNTEQQISQVPGGQVYELQEILDDLVRYNLTNHAAAPSDLPTFARFRFAIRETYSYSAALNHLPLEFAFLPSDFRLMYSKTSASKLINLKF